MLPFLRYFDVQELDGWNFSFEWDATEYVRNYIIAESSILVDSHDCKSNSACRPSVAVRKTVCEHSKQGKPAPAEARYGGN